MTEIGTVIDGKYEILREIGRGGMSVVYLAMDTHLNKQWAVKEIRKKGSGKNDEIVVNSLLAEANMMKKPILKPTGYGNCLQGFFKLPEESKHKYKGDPNKIIYRSSWERKFMTYCCSNSSIAWWTSEYPIQYISPIDETFALLNIF